MTFSVPDNEVDEEVQLRWYASRACRDIYRQELITDERMQY